MTDGMRRPPRLWEQKLEARIRAAGVGVGVSSGGVSPIVGGPVPGPGGSGESQEEVPVVDPDPTTPRVPSTPSVFPAIGGLSILWTGLDSVGDPFPAGCQAEVHVSETTGFTPDAATLRGVVGAGERLVVTGLTSGTTYFVRFVLIFPDGSTGETSAEQSLSAGFVLSTNIGQGEITADLVNFNASAIGGIQQFVGTTAPTITNAGQANQTPANGSTWINTSNLSYYTLTNGAWVQRQWGQAAISAGAISTGQLAAGAITANSAIIANGAIGNAQIANAAITDAKIQNMSADKLTAGTINASFITVANIDASNITTGTLSARTVQTTGGGRRIVMNPTANSIQFFNQNGTVVELSPGADTAGVPLLDIDGGGLTVADNIEASSCRPMANRIVFQGYRLTSTGSDVMMRLNSNNGATNRAQFEVDADGSVKSRANSYGGFSDARFKENITPARQYLDDLRDIEIVNFNFQGDDRKQLGVTAQQVAEIFPSLVSENDEGELSVRYSVFVPMLITAVQELADKVDTLTARLDALEARLP